jgi:ParB family transcriptional regulator, chromosome partitioning protein
VNKPSVPQVRGVATFLNSTERSEQIKSAAIATPPQYIDPKLLVRSPYQPRTTFPEDELNELRQSAIAAGGIKVPVIARPDLNQLIAGERRQIIAIELGFLVPVHWHTCTDLEAAELAGFENVKRADLNAIDETNLILNMIRMRLELVDRQAAIDLVQQILYQQRSPESESHNNVIMSDVVEQVEKTIRDFTKGQSSFNSFVNNKLKLLNLPKEVVEAIRSNQIEYTKAAEIGKIKDEAIRGALLGRAVKEGLSVTQVKEAVAKTKPPKAPKAAKIPKQVESGVDELPSIESDEAFVIESKEDSSLIAAHLGEQIPNVQLGQSQPDLTVETNQETIDDSIQEITETIRFKISNDAYTLETKQEIKELLDQVVKLLN